MTPWREDLVAFDAARARGAEALSEARALLERVAIHMRTGNAFVLDDIDCFLDAHPPRGGEPDSVEGQASAPTSPVAAGPSSRDTGLDAGRTAPTAIHTAPAGAGEAGTSTPPRGGSDSSVSPSGASPATRFGGPETEAPVAAARIIDPTRTPMRGCAVNEASDAAPQGAAAVTPTGQVAQMAEHSTPNREVEGSIPSRPATSTGQAAPLDTGSEIGGTPARPSPRAIAERAAEMDAIIDRAARDDDYDDTNPAPRSAAGGGQGGDKERMAGVGSHAPAPESDTVSLQATLPGQASAPLSPPASPAAAIMSLAADYALIASWPIGTPGRLQAIDKARAALAAKVGEVCGEKHAAVVAIQDALGNGIDEDAWPPGTPYTVALARYVDGLRAQLAAAERELNAIGGLLTQHGYPERDSVIGSMALQVAELIHDTRATPCAAAVPVAELRALMQRCEVRPSLLCPDRTYEWWLLPARALESLIAKHTPASGEKETTA